MKEFDLPQEAADEAIRQVNELKRGVFKSPNGKFVIYDPVDAPPGYELIGEVSVHTVEDAQLRMKIVDLG